jgi:hypothetical protein
MVDSRKLKEQMTPTLWSFEISTEVWSRVQLVEAVVPNNHNNASAMVDGLRQALWPATRTEAMIVGECTHSGTSSGHGRDGSGAGWLLGGYGDREYEDNMQHTHIDQQQHHLPGLWRLAVATGEERRALTPSIAQ